MGLEQSGMELILKDSFSAVGKRYAQTVGQVNRVDEQSAKVAALAAKARQSYAKTVSQATTAVKSAADSQRKALRAMLDESQSMQTALDPSKWTKSVESVKKTVADLIPAGVKDRLSGFAQGIEGVIGKMGFLPSSIQGAIGSLGNFSTALGGTVGAMSIATAGAVALAAAFIALGMRGAAMRGVVEAFDISADRAGVLANVLLGDLRSAARGTVTDMQLMLNANRALAGVQGELAYALGKEGGLAGLLEVARAQSRATGYSVDFLFESLVNGIKRAQPLLIDNTYLVIGADEANQAYAKSVGKTVAELTKEERQIAILNATLAAGQSAVETYGNRSLTAAERMARINTTITNTLDRLALAVQPAFELLLAVGETVLNVLVYPIRDILLPVFSALVQTIFGPLTLAWESLTAGLSDLLAPALQTVHRWVVLVVAVIQGFGYALQWIVRTASAVLAPFKDVIKKTIVEPIAKYLDPAAFAKRAGFIFGAFATGILAAANTMIFPAVIFIAETIASFLMGNSPPEQGPLSTIDQGAANLMQAWLEGFTGVSLTPVSDMAASINAQLGDIGNLTNAQARAMLAQLNAQLQPFIDNLKLAKARMEAIVAPLKEARDILQKQVTKNVKAFFAGDLSAEELRALDAQNQAVRDQLSAYQDMTDEAELQLALMQAQQAVQRAQLEIQIAHTEEAAALADATGGGTGSSSAGGGSGSSSAGGGGSEASIPAGGGGFSLPNIDANPVGDFMGVTDEEVNQLFGDLSAGFTAGVTDFPQFNEQLALAQSNAGTLGDALSNISSSNAFQGITTAIDTVFGSGADSIRTKIKGFVDDVKKWFTEDLQGYFDGISLTKITGEFTGAFGSVTGTVRSAVDGFVTRVTDCFGGSLPDIFDGFSLTKITDTFTGAFDVNTGAIRTAAKTFCEDVKQWFGLDLPGVFKGFSLDNIADTFADTFGIPDGTAWSSVKQTYSAIKNLFENNFSTLFDGFSLDGIADTFTNTFGIPDGTAWSNIRRTYNAIRNLFDGNFSSIFNDFSLQGIADKFTDTFGIPDGTAWSSVKRTYNAIRNLFDGNFSDIFDGFSLDGIAGEFLRVFGLGTGSTWSTINDFVAAVQDWFDVDLSGVFNTFSLTGITDQFRAFFSLDTGSIRTFISDFVADVQGWFTVDLPGWFNGFNLDGLTAAFQVFQPGGAVYDALNTFVSWVDDLLNPDGTLGQLAGFLGESLVAGLPGVGLLGDVTGALFGGGGGGNDEQANHFAELLATLPILDTTTWTNTLGEGGTIRVALDSFILYANTAWSTAFGAEGTLTVLLDDWFLKFETIFGEDIPTLIEDFSLLSLMDAFTAAFGQQASLDGDNVGISAMLASFSTLFTQIMGEGGRLEQAMGTIGPSLSRLIARPFEAILNAVLAGMTTAMNEAIRVLNNMITGYNALGIGNAIPILQRIEAPPTISMVPSAKLGAFLGEGLAKVHQGETLVSASKPYMVFPARWVTAMETIARNTTQQSYRPLPAAQPVIMNAGDSASGMNIYQTFTGQADNNSVRRGWYELQALGAIS